MNKLPNTETKINLKGIMIGNGCTNPRECYEPTFYSNDSMSIYQYEFLWYHNYINDQDYQTITGSCTLGYNSTGCLTIRKKVDGNFAKTQTVINNIYQPCYHQTIPFLPQNQAIKLQQGRKHVKSFESCEDLLGIYQFFNDPLIFAELHVKPIKFDICNSDVENKYKMFSNASQWLYP